MLPEENTNLFQNPFKIFCIKPGFSINKHDLKKKYFDLSRAHHPDLNPSSGDRIKEINQAYKILSNDLERARFIKKDGHPPSGDFLWEVLEMEEEISRISDSGDLKGMFRKLTDLINECKRNYKEGDFLSKWVYYERLMKGLKEKETQMELENKNNKD